MAIFTLLACGPGMVDVDEFMSFFMPESSNASAQNQKYNYTSNFFYGENEFESNEDTVDHCRNENILAWQKYCNNKVAGNEIAKGIYGKFGSSALQKYLTQSKNELAKNYIALAKEIDSDFEKTVNSYEGEENKYVSKADVLEQKALALLNVAKQNKDSFIEERIAFQLVKFSAVKKNYEEAVSRYEKLILPIKQKSFISDWALMRKAEAETSLGNKAEAYYDFAQVFDRSESHRNQADVVVRARIDSLVIDDSVLKFCKNDHEKAAVYAFAGIKPTTDALPMLEKMVEIEPQNPMLELIMAREINKNEAYYYRQIDWEYVEDSTETKKKQQIASDYWSKLKDFSVKTAENQKVAKTGFWQIASAYMEYIEGDLAKSEEFLNQAKAINSQNQGLKNQILIQDLLLTSKKTKEITPEVEMAYLSILEQIGKPKGFRMSNAVLESCNMLASKYRGVQPVSDKETKGGFLSSCSGKKSSENVPVSVPNAIAKAYLLTMLTTYQAGSGEEYGGYMSQKDMFPIEDTTSLATIKKLVQYVAEPNKSDFDKRLQKLVGFDNDHLYTLMGRRAMDEHNYAKAAEAFGKVNPKIWKDDVWTSMFNEDPFYISPKYGDEKPNTNYTPVSFAQKMAELEAKLKANPNDAESAYLLGCGAFNTSTHGNAWILRRHGWSASEVNSYDKKEYNFDYYQATKAKEYFEKGMKSTNPEIAAKSCYGAALCERVAFDVFVASQDTSNEMDMNKFTERMNKERIAKFSIYFQLLKTKYQNTAYQKQVLEECGDYSAFAGE
ncbi:hypothetical protein LV89_02454 [Arcicella aurantiaca]|uniref:Tetratricopeptide repeat protein n=1 Tax=Arcicella aurantiaca TaxID=591202 RepID=A0A316E9F5_9BACT|nr:hypothetical protein [Arcicella aurantiaca]PWK26605.1 hypothetical protein LV89_02454 [Arcicella aurantiaca]